MVSAFLTLSGGGGIFPRSGVPPTLDLWCACVYTSQIECAQFVSLSDATIVQMEGTRTGPVGVLGQRESSLPFSACSNGLFELGAVIIVLVFNKHNSLPLGPI